MQRIQLLTHRYVGQTQMKVTVRYEKATASLLYITTQIHTDVGHKYLIVKERGGRTAHISCGIMTIEQNKGRWRKVRDRHYQAVLRRSGRRRRVGSPASGLRPQHTGPPWQPDLHQNSYCCRIQPELAIASRISFSAAQLLWSPGLNLEAAWVSDPQMRHVPVLHLQQTWR